MHHRRHHERQLAHLRGARHPLPSLGCTADDIVRDMIGFVAQRLMELDVANRCGAAHGERSEERTNSRNGYRDRNWDTRAGTVALRRRSAAPSARCGLRDAGCGVRS